MTSGSQTEWYIARDGEQHGPLSGIEMQTFIDLGHLQETDLVWCAEFANWRPAPEVFPRPVEQEQPPQAQARQQSTDRTGAGLARSAGDAASASAAGWAGQVSEPVSSASTVQASSMLLPNDHGAASINDYVASVRQEAHSAGTGPVDQQGYELRVDTGWSDGADGRRGRIAGDRSGRGAVGPHDGGEFSDNDVYEPEPRRGLGRVAAVAAGILIIGGAGWIGWQNLPRLPDVTSLGSAVVAKVVQTDSGAAQAYQQSPFVADGATRAEIDVALQKSAVWKVLKRDFNGWYAERVADIERMRGQNEDEKVIAKFLADVIVVLRRKNGQAALQSTPEGLRGMASAFLANLKQLASRDAQTCFGFISFGEANPFMLELSKAPAFAESLQRQLIAIFGAVAQGKASPNIYQSALRTDFEALKNELVRRGWSQDDLAVFSDPRRLSRSPPEKVCQMVQDWFGAQLALKDPQMQNRLLAESLKPLVLG